MKMKYLIGSLVLSAMLVGCGRGSAPSCDDSDVESVLSDLIVSVLKENYGISIKKNKLRFSDHITEDESTDKKTYCKATASYKGKSTVLYSAQYTDKGDKVYVELFDIQEEN